MRTLLHIRDLLEAGKLEEAITALEFHLERYPDGDLVDQLAQLKDDQQQLASALLRGEINENLYLLQHQQLTNKLLAFLEDLFPQQEQQQQTPSFPPPATAAPPRSGGGILSKAIDAFKDLISSKSTSAPQFPPVSHRVPTPKSPPLIDGNEEELSPHFPTFEELDTSSAPEDWEEEVTSAEPIFPETSGSPPPAPTPTPPAATSPFQKGKILYAIPDQMALEIVSRCQVRIAPEQLGEEDMLAGLSPAEKAAATQEPLKITPVMKVELAEAQAGNNFTIVARNNPEQPIIPFMPTTWSYDVTPHRPGHYALLLRVTAKVQIPGYGERPYDVAVLDRAIQVNTADNPTETVTFSEQPIPDPEWDQEDEAAVRQALLHGRVDLAIERIINFVQDKDTDFRDTLLLLQFRWNDNSNQLRNKLISPEDWDRVNNQVRYGITQLLEELKQHFAPGTTTSNMDWKKREQLLREQL